MWSIANIGLRSWGSNEILKFSPLVRMSIAGIFIKSCKLSLAYLGVTSPTTNKQCWTLEIIFRKFIRKRVLEPKNIIATTIPFVIIALFYRNLLNISLLKLGLQ